MLQFETLPILDTSNNLYGSPLHCACLTSSRDSVVALLEAGAPVDLPNSKGGTALFTAVGAGSKIIVSALFAVSAHLDARNQKGETVLHAAARAKNSHDGTCYSSMINLLLENSADPDLQDSQGVTP